MHPRTLLTTPTEVAEADRLFKESRAKKGNGGEGGTRAAKRTIKHVSGANFHVEFGFRFGERVYSAVDYVLSVQLK